MIKWIKSLPWKTVGLAAFDALQIALALFAADATLYHNSANEVDVMKAVGLFVLTFARCLYNRLKEPPK